MWLLLISFSNLRILALFHDESELGTRHDACRVYYWSWHVTYFKQKWLLFWVFARWLAVITHVSSAFKITVNLAVVVRILLVLS
jgi:hypothetical protein